MKSDLQQRIIVILLALLVGAGSGVLATAMTTTYLSNYALELGQTTAPLRLADQRPRAVPQTYEDARAELVQQVLPAMVQLIRTSPDGLGSSADVLRSGVLLTTDGWAAFPSGTALPSVAFLSIARDGELFEVEELVSDPETGVVFVRANLGLTPVVTYGSLDAAQVGDQFFVVQNPNSFALTQLVRVEAAGTPQTSDAPGRRLQLAPVISEGGVAVNLVGEFVGFVSEQENAWGLIDWKSIEPSFDAFLRTGEIAHASLGIQYTDLSFAFQDDPSTRLYQGALVRSVIGVQPGTDLRVGDIITEVNGRPLNTSHTLGDVVSRSKVGDVIVLTLWRDEERTQVSVTLQAKR